MKRPRAVARQVYMADIMCEGVEYFFRIIYLLCRLTHFILKGSFLSITTKGFFNYAASPKGTINEKRYEKFSNTLKIIIF